MEDQLNISEQSRLQLRDKLRETEESSKEMINFIKNL